MLNAESFWKDLESFERIASYFKYFSIVVGIGAAALSGYLEYLFFLNVLNSSWRGFLLASVLEGAKLSVSFSLPFIAKGGSVTTQTKLLSRSLIVGLFGLSAVCSLGVFSEQLDQPNAEEVRRSELAELERRRGEIDATYASEKKIIENDFIVASEKAENRYQYTDSEDLLAAKTSYEKMEKELINESNRVVNGVVRGPKYDAKQELLQNASRRLSEAQKQAEAEKRQLDEHRFNELNKLELSRNARFIQAEEKYEKAVAALRENHDGIVKKVYRDDARASNKLLVATVNNIKVTLPDLNALNLGSFTAYISLLIAILLELSIYTTFRIFTEYYNPASKVYKDVQDEKR